MNLISSIDTKLLPVTISSVVKIFSERLNDSMTCLVVRGQAGTGRDEGGEEEKNKGGGKETDSPETS